MEQEMEMAVRPMDELGRIVLPFELRQMLDFQAKESVRIIKKGDEIVIRKYKPSCTFCRTEEDLIAFNGKCICRECGRAINALIESEH